MTALIPILWNSDNSVPLDAREAVESIKSSRRRYVLLIMDDVESPHSVGDLAEAIAAIEQDKEIPELTSQDRKRVYIALVQHHLDKLDQLGAIADHERSKQVYESEATEGLADLVRHHESICSNDE